jgi:large subunit ribosomal protein L28
MAKSCEVCGKGPKFGRQQSHAHNVSPRRFLPNIQTVKALIDGSRRRIYACTRCIRSGFVTKAPVRPKAAAAVKTA